MNKNLIFFLVIIMLKEITKPIGLGEFLTSNLKMKVSSSKIRTKKSTGKYKIFDKYFNTKKDSYLFIKNMLSKYSYGKNYLDKQGLIQEGFDFDDTIVFNKHYKSDFNYLKALAEIGEIKRFRITKTNRSTKVEYCYNISKSYYSMAWAKLSRFTPSKTTHRKICNVLRDLVAKECTEFKRLKTVFDKNYHIVCNKCHLKHFPNQTEVDHIYEFWKIKRDFVKHLILNKIIKREEDLTDTVYIDSNVFYKDSMSVFRLDHLNKMFIVFHKKYKLQILCKTCHSKKTYH